MGGSKGPQPRYLVAAGVIFLVFMPILLQCCIDNVYSRVKQQPISVKFGIVWFIWATGVFIYWFAFAPFKVFKDLHIPYIKPESFLGNLREFTTLGANEFYLKYMKQLGPVFGAFLGRRPIFVISDPDLLKQIMIKDFKKFQNRPIRLQTKKPMDKSLLNAEGEIWKRIRSTASPTFTAGKIKKTVPLIQECLDSLIPVLEKSAKGGGSLEVFRTYGKLTMDGILSVAFGTAADLQTKEEKDTFSEKVDTFFRPTPIFAVFESLDPPIWLRRILYYFFATIDPKYFVDMLQPIINERKKYGKSVRKDFLDLMLTEIPDGSNKLADDEIAANSITFLLAGYETTANTLAYTTYLLALNPEVQEKLYQEIKEKFNDDESLSVYDRVQNLEYLDQVLSESLRLYPPAYQTGRVADEDCVIGENHISLDRNGGDKGIKISKGSEIFIPIWGIHHNQEFWENPEEFNPDRFSPDNKAKVNPLTYMPFGQGPRNCIGMRFALLEAKLALATIVQKFKFERSPDTEVPLPIRLGLTMSPKNGIYLRVISRQ